MENVRREDWIVGGLALLLAIFLLVLPWFTASAFGVSASESATGDPDGWLGILAFLVCLAIIADLAVENFSPQTQLPVLNTRAHTRFVMAVIVAVLVVLKFLFHIHFSGIVKFGWGFYVDVVVTAALVYVALQVRNGAPLPGVGGPTAGGPRGGSPARTTTPPAGATTPPAGGTTAPPPAEPGGGTPPPRV